MEKRCRGQKKQLKMRKNKRKQKKEKRLGVTLNEEADIAIENYIAEIRLELEQEQRTKKWVKDHFL